MRLFTMLALAAIGIVIFQGTYFRGKTEKAYTEAIGHLPDDPDAAYAAIKPTFKYSNVVTLGKITQTRDRFFATARDRVVVRMEDEDTGKGWFVIVGANLSLLQRVEIDLEIDLSAHRDAIVEAARRAGDGYRERLALDDWDAYVAFVKRLAEDGGPATGAEGGIEAWLADLERTDRRAILERDTVLTATRGLAAGVAALGLTASASPRDPLVGPLDPPLSSSDLQNAMQNFRRAGNACRRYARLFGEPIPESIRVLKAKAAMNSSAIMAAHLIELNDAGGWAVSSFMARLVVKPGADSIPSDGEVRGAYINGTAGGISNSLAELQALGRPTGEYGLLLAVQFRNQMFFAREIKSEGVGRSAEASYQRLRNNPASMGLGLGDFAVIEAGAPIWIALR